MTAAAKKLLVVLCFLALTGCWDKKELSDQVFVMGMGIDMEENFYKISAQIVKPIPPGVSGATMSGSTNPTWNISAKGHTIHEAVSQLNRISPRRLEWTHLELIVFNKKVAEKGLQILMTWFEREADTNSSAIVVVTSVPAEDLLNIRFEIEEIPAKSIADLIIITEKQNITARRIHMHQLNHDMSEMGIDPSVDMVEPRKTKGKLESIQITGSAIFKDDKLVGELRIPVNIGIELMLRRTNYASFTIGCPNFKDRFISFLATKIDNKIRPIVKNGKVTVHSEIYLEGSISGSTCTLDFTDSKSLRLVEKRIEDKVEDIVISAFKTGAAKGSDIYGIGREIRKRHPRQWREIQDNWHAKLPDISFDIQVDAKILRTGLIRQYPKVK